MDIKDVARTSREALDGKSVLFGACRHAALMGYLKGIEDGTLRTGQRLIGEILLSPSSEGSSGSRHSDLLKPKDLQAITALFASGICSEGESLYPQEFSKTWTDRA